MDVVNGKIVESRRKASSSSSTQWTSWGGVIMTEHAWSGLKPSRARVVKAGTRPARPAEQHHGHRFAPAGEWAPSWAALPNANGASSGGDSMSALALQQLQLPSGGGVCHWGAAAAPGIAAPSHGPASMSPAPGAYSAAKWNRLLVSPDMGGHGHLSHGPGHGHGHIHGPPVADQRPGWKRSSPRSWDASSDHRRQQQQQRQYSFDFRSPCTELKLDEEMTIFESHITMTVSDHFTNLTSSLGHEIAKAMAPLAMEPSPAVAEAAGSCGNDAAEQKSSEFVNSDVLLKRKRSGLPESDIQGGCGWIHPLKLLVRKGLTMSDVGELGRIIIPKKDAESRSFPQIDRKEGTVLEMEDYTASKRWYFRFKYWINNKSRMYVLENTGEFIKYHCLKEHDMFVVYEDGCKHLVVCGQKKSRNNSNPGFDLSKGSLIDSSASETPTTTTTTEDEISHLTNIDNTVACS